MLCPRPTRLPRSRRPAHSLVEVVLGIALMGATLTPALELVRDALDLSQETDRRQLLANFAVSQIEQRLGVTAATWANASYTGDYAAEGLADVRFVTVCSDAVASGGIVGSLMDIRTTCYWDADDDDALDSGELRSVFRTKIGRFATYTNLAN
ncbi:MAG: hypothetical protein ACRCT8_03030 [Lacipirellulaceae bacterium]